jgi:hypothetical protein
MMRLSRSPRSISTASCMWCPRCSSPVPCVTQGGGVEGGGTGLFGTYRSWCRQLLSYSRSLYALALMFPPKLSSHTHNALSLSSSWVGRFARSACADWVAETLDRLCQLPSRWTYPIRVNSRTHVRFATSHPRTTVRERKPNHCLSLTSV